MNLDANVQKIIAIVLRRWKLVVLFALIFAILAGFHTAYFTTLTYTSRVEFMAYAKDGNKEMSDTIPGSDYAEKSISNTSKMNYAMKMLNTYIEMFQTNEFNRGVAEAINEAYNTSHSAGTIKGATTIETVEETAMFKITVTTTDPDLSYQIAHQLEVSIPESMESTNNGLVSAAVVDKPLKASASESKDYTKKCAIGAAIGAVIAILYIILRDLIDIRVKSGDELNVMYDAPILGAIPVFDFKTHMKLTDETKANDKYLEGEKKNA